MHIHQTRSATKYLCSFVHLSILHSHAFICPLVCCWSDFQSSANWRESSSTPLCLHPFYFPHHHHHHRLILHSVGINFFSHISLSIPIFIPFFFYFVLLIFPSFLLFSLHFFLFLHFFCFLCNFFSIKLFLFSPFSFPFFFFLLHSTWYFLC